MPADGFVYFVVLQAVVLLQGLGAHGAVEEDGDLAFDGVDADTQLVGTL